MSNTNTDFQSTLKMTAQGLKCNHPWKFKTYFRTNAYGWRGSQLASKRLKEAWREINKVNKTNQLLAAEGCIFLMSRLWPAFQHIDTSSGALGGAVYSVMELLLPIIIAAPTQEKLRQNWLDLLWQILEEDGVDYTANIAGYWGELAGSTDETSKRADEFESMVKLAWSQGGFVGHHETAYLSALIAAKRYDEILQAVEQCPRPSWFIRRYAAEVMSLSDPEKAIAYAEESRNIINTSSFQIDHFCESVLLKHKKIEDAYRRYGIEANQARTYLTWFNNIKKKYASIRTDHQILNDLINSGVAEPGKWFATANKLNCFDLALKLIKDSPAEPKTLNRAAKARLADFPDYALNVALASLHWLVKGYGYEISNYDLFDALRTISKAANHLGKWNEVSLTLKKYADADDTGFFKTAIHSYLRSPIT